MKACIRKLKRNRGMTLAEVLIAVLILLMVTAVVAAGMPVAANAYTKVVDAANAQVLLSTTMTALRDQLETAEKEIERGGTGEGESPFVQYYSSETLRTTLVSTDEGIMLYPYENETYTVDSNNEYKRPLVSTAAATKNLYARFESIEFKDGVFTVTGLQVCRKGTDQVITEIPGESGASGTGTYLIRILNEEG